MAVSDQKIYLASKSPRRRELLRQIGVEFELLMLRDEPGRHGSVSEESMPGEAPEIYVTRIAREKAQSGWEALTWRKLPRRPVLAADTTVTVDGQILGKPADVEEAKAMLRSLSGRTHQVLTAVAVIAHDQLTEVLQRSEVSFADLPESLLHAYCATAEPYDKAGGYGIQGHAAQFIERINGSYSGIMGLPLFETSRLLHRAGIRLL